MLFDIWAGIQASYKLRDYKPQPVTMRSVFRWLRQFPKEDRPALRLLLSKVIYLSEEETQEALVKLNAILLKRLTDAGIPINKIIYVQYDQAGSSSGLMLNILRDTALLEKRGCKFIDARDVLRFRETTGRLEGGAIIYVDDFIGSASQFTRAREFLNDHILGNFSEFVLLPCICEEAFPILDEQGVEPVAHKIHKKSERPLHAEGDLLPPNMKARLEHLGRKLNSKNSLGFKGLATMVVIYRNSPNSTPLILRGSLRQKPYFGVLPRTTDLAVS